MTTKRLFFAGLGTLLAIIAILLYASLGGPRPRYRADSLVVASPYTNILFRHSFEAYVARTIPGVLRLQVTTASSRSSAGNAAESVAIRIIGIGQTAEEAQRAANDAATQLCRTVLTNYGVTGRIVAQANGARSYSFFHDSFQPGIVRIFKR